MSKRALEKLAAAVLLLPLTAATAAGSEDVLTLEEAKRIALANNHQLAVAEAAVLEAEATIEEARSALYPKADLWETFMRTTNPVFVFGNKLGQSSFGPEDFDFDALNNPDALNNWNTRLSVTQPIWTGGRIRRHIEAAERGAQASGFGRERTRQEVLHQVIEAHTGAIVADRHLLVAEEALETANAHVELVTNMYNAGLAVESDLLQAQVRESEVEEMVIRANSAIAIAQAVLNMVMGRGLDTPIALPETLDVDELRDLDLDALVDEALRSRPDLAAMSSQVAAAERMVAAEKATYLPQIGFSGAYELNAEDFIGADGTNWTLMFALQFNIFDSSRYARVRQTRARQIQAERGRELLAQAVALEVKQAFHEHEAATQRLEQARKAMSLAEESLRMIQNRYREGLTTLVVLQDAETALTRARTRAISAGRDLLLSRATLDLAIGRL